MSYGDYDFNFAPGGGVDLDVLGSELFVRASDGALRITLNTGEIVTLTQNQGIELKGKQFRSVNVKNISGAPNAGLLFIGDATFRDQTFTGTVVVLNVNGAFSQAEVAVTNAAGGSVLLAAKANRRYLMVQNNDAAAVLRVTVDGSAPSAVHGVRLLPGAQWEPAGFVPTGQVRAFSDVAGADVTAVEG